MSGSCADGAQCLPSSVCPRDVGCDRRCERAGSTALPKPGSAEHVGLERGCFLASQGDIVGRGALLYPDPATVRQVEHAGNRQYVLAIFSLYYTERGADARRERIAIAVDCIAEQPRERGGFLVGQIKDSRTWDR
jgi:hypothetical protein